MLFFSNSGARGLIRYLPQAINPSIGSPVSTTINGAPVIQLRDGNTDGVTLEPIGVIGKAYEVFIYLSTSGSNGARLGGKLEFTTNGTLPSGGNTNYFNINVPSGSISKHQLTFGIHRVNTNFRHLLTFVRAGADGSDTNTSTINIHKIELVPIENIRNANVSDAGTITPTIYPTPFNGETVWQLPSLYTPIMSSSNFVYLTQAVTITGVQQTRLCKLNKSDLTTIQDVQTLNIAHDGIKGHRGASVIIDENGTVITHPASHQTPWSGKKASSEDISSLSAISTPVGLNTWASYRRFFKNPYNNEVWMSVRGNDFSASIYKWNGESFDRKPNGSFLAGDTSNGFGSYGMEIAFANATEIYVTTEWMQGTSGYPRRNISILKSTDDGATWYTLDGKLCKMPQMPNQDGVIAFPSRNNYDDVAMARIAIGADKLPILFGDWGHAYDNKRSLWMAKWNPQRGRFDRKMLDVPSAANENIAAPYVIYNSDGKILVSYASTADHTFVNVGGGAGSEKVPVNNFQRLLVSTDSGNSWRKYTINHIVGGYGTMYLDEHAFRNDNIIRALPLVGSDPTRSEIWTFDIPS